MQSKPIGRYMLPAASNCTFRWHSLLPLILLLLATLSPTVRANTDDPVYRIKASYIYNILQFVNFPPEVGKELTICILGENRFGKSLAELNAVTTPQAVLHVVVLGRYSSDTPLRHCNVLYLVASEEEKTTAILSNIDPLRTLTIGENKHFLKDGGLIELYEKDDTIQFRIDPNKANKTLFKLDAQLIQLGIE